jgi:hypothetical protein
MGGDAHRRDTRRTRTGHGSGPRDLACPGGRSLGRGSPRWSGRPSRSVRRWVLHLDGRASLRRRGLDGQGELVACKPGRGSLPDPSRSCSSTARTSRPGSRVTAATGSAQSGRWRRPSAAPTRGSRRTARRRRGGPAANEGAGAYRAGCPGGLALNPVLVTSLHPPARARPGGRTARTPTSMVGRRCVPAASACQVAQRSSPTSTTPGWGSTIAPHHGLASVVSARRTL